MKEICWRIPGTDHLPPALHYHDGDGVWKPVTGILKGQDGGLIISPEFAKFLKLRELGYTLVAYRNGQKITIGEGELCERQTH